MIDDKGQPITGISFSFTTIIKVRFEYGWGKTDAQGQFTLTTFTHQNCFFGFSKLGFSRIQRAASLRSTPIRSPQSRWPRLA